MRERCCNVRRRWTWHEREYIVVKARRSSGNANLSRFTIWRTSSLRPSCSKAVPAGNEQDRASSRTSEASRASDLDVDQGSNLRRICLTCLFATPIRLDRTNTTDVSQKKKHGFWWIWKKWKMKQPHKWFVFWSGRWESNPRPKLGKLLYCHYTTPARFSSLLIIHD